VPTKSTKSTGRKLTPRTHARGWPESVRMRAVAPSLTVNDLEASVAFYCDVLGFIVAERWEEAGALRGVRLKSGACEFFLAQDDWKKGRDRTKGIGFRLLCMTVQEIDALAESIKARGGKLAREPMDQLWGVRDLEVVDPDGFLITIYKTL
jgi:catechol 2,3-dioxygenase-like lactoylglutathione lyase family enzyme